MKTLDGQGDRNLTYASSALSRSDIITQPHHPVQPDRNAQPLRDRTVQHTAVPVHSKASSLTSTESTTIDWVAQWEAELQAEGGYEQFLLRMEDQRMMPIGAGDGYMQGMMANDPYAPLWPEIPDAQTVSSAPAKITLDSTPAWQTLDSSSTASTPNPTGSQGHGLAIAPTNAPFMAQPTAPVQPATQVAAQWGGPLTWGHIPEPSRFAPQAQPPFTLHPPPPAPPLVAGNQGKTTRANNGGLYGQHVRNNPPVNVQPPLNMDISILEIMTFFPDWLQIPAFAMRAVRNGYTARDLAKMNLHSMGQLTKKSLETGRTRVTKQFTHGGLIYVGLKPTKSGETPWSGDAFRRVHGSQNELTANEWELRWHLSIHARRMEFGHIKLSVIHGRVPPNKWPTGQDRLLLTQCLEFARQNPQLDLDTSHFDWIIHTHGLQTPQVGSGADHDAASLTRFNRAVPDPRH
ncbi:hypothetical protein LTR65_009767 [Meristemomyces frigidus]